MAPDKLTNLVRAYRLLRRSRLTRQELADVLGIHERSARRLIQDMRGAGLDVRERERKGSRELEYRARLI